MATNADPSRSTLWIVEAWRGLASLLVLWAHWGPPLHWPMGPMAFAFTGVDLFFVLSGFVFAPQVTGSTSSPLPAYAIRRVTRIYPAYLVALSLYVALAWSAGRPLLYVSEHMLMAHLQSREMAFYYNPAFWSLPSELSFYLIVPMLGWALSRWGGGSHGHMRLLSIIFAWAFCMRFALLYAADGSEQNLSYVLLNHLPGLLAEFLLGVWVWQRWQTGLQHWHCIALGLTGMFGWLALAFLFCGLQDMDQALGWRNGQLGLAAAACFALMLLASLRLPHFSQYRWVHQAGLWAGKLSYSIYLLHFAWLAPAMAWAQHWGPAMASFWAIAALLGSCLLLHSFIEEPARRWGRRASKRWSAQKTSVSPG